MAIKEKKHILTDDVILIVYTAKKMFCYFGTGIISQSI